MCAVHPESWIQYDASFKQPGQYIFNSRYTKSRSKVWSLLWFPTRTLFIFGLSSGFWFLRLLPLITFSRQLLVVCSRFPQVSERCKANFYGRFPPSIKLPLPFLEDPSCAYDSVLETAESCVFFHCISRRSILFTGSKVKAQSRFSNASNVTVRLLLDHDRPLSVAMSCLWLSITTFMDFKVASNCFTRSNKWAFSHHFPSTPLKFFNVQINYTTIYGARKHLCWQSQFPWQL